jgi:hypothetical protein
MKVVGESGAEVVGIADGKQVLVDIGIGLAK